MRARRRAAALLLPALGALASCGIPATGVVEAGGPAGGVVPRTRVYFLDDTGELVGILRPTDAPGDVESALRSLFQGPTDGERMKRLRTDLPLPTGMPTPAPAATGAQEYDSSGLLTVTTRHEEISVELSPAVGELSGDAVAQIVCTAVAAQRVADPRAEPAPVRVTGPDGRRVEGSGAQCPDG